MSEVRSTLPYISHLRVTKRPTQKWEPTGYQNQNGEDLYRQGVDLPGIECEVVRYMGTVKGPATQYRFPLKAFFEEALEQLQAAPVKNEQTTKAIENLQQTIANPNTIWAETVLLAGNLPELRDLWKNVYSDALDEFDKWREPQGQIGGIPVYVKEMQWDARIPFESAKSITLKVGIYDNNEDLGIPEIYTLSFEDAATRAQREGFITHLNQRITLLEAEIAALPEGSSTTRTQKERELTDHQNELKNRSMIENGLMNDLLANESVQQSLPVLILSIIGTLKNVYWPDLDMQLVQEKLTETLAALTSV